MKRLTAILILAAAGHAEAAAVAPHRAIYDLSLLRLGEGSSLQGVDGRLAFEVEGSACEGWTVNFRMVSEYRPKDGDIRTVDTQSTSFEGVSGLDMHYSQKEFVDRKLQGEIRIKVSRAAADRDGEGQMDEPESRTFSVPGGAFFPMQHQIKLMDAASHGLSRDVSLIYDGSDGDNLFRAISFIGPRRDAGKNASGKANGEAAALAGLPSWPISISYYAAEGGEETPSYQISFDLHENGIATGLVLDYGDFVLRGDLKELEMLRAGTCE